MLQGHYLVVCNEGSARPLEHDALAAGVVHHSRYSIQGVIVVEVGAG